MKSRTFAKRYWRFVSLAITISLASLILFWVGCGGGGGGGGSTEDADIGVGWVTIEEPDESYVSTDSDAMWLKGEAFISPGYPQLPIDLYGYSGEKDTGVTVIWENATNGNSGGTLQRFIIYPILIDNSFTHHYWTVDVPLFDGDNLIKITASDKAGNIGRTSVAITRIPSPPKVLSVFPAANDTGVAIDTPITASFSEAIDASFIDISSFILEDADSNLINGTVTYEDKTAIFQPFTTLASGTFYSATITEEVQDLAGNAMAADYTWSFTTGGNYWHPISMTGALFGPSGDTAVWTGTEMIVWGCGSDIGGRYNPAMDAWGPISIAGAPSVRSGHAALWTGTEMIVWGGWDGTGAVNTGGRYNPAIDTWTQISTIGAPPPSVDYTAVWTGTEMFVWGGSDGNGGKYNPATDTWLSISTTLAPEGRVDHSAVWTGKEMIVWGGWDGSTWSNTGASYDPETDIWRPISLTNAPSGRDGHVAVWTGTEMVVWGGRSGAPGNTRSNTGGRYDPATGIWQPTSTTGAPYLAAGHTVIWTGKEMMVWGQKEGISVMAGGRYSPTANSWGAIPVTAAPSESARAAVWTGTEMIVWGCLFDNSGRYIP